MATSPIRLTTSNDVTLNTNSNIINLHDNTNASFVYQPTLVFINGQFIGEGISGTAAVNNESTITLRENYTGPNIVNGKLAAANTLEGLGNAIARIEAAIAGLGNFNDLPSTGVGILEKTGENTYDLRLISDDSDVVNSTDANLITANQANIISKFYSSVTPKAEFFAKAEQNKRNNSGSGFLEWGKIWTGASDPLLSVNEGIWNTATIGYQETLRMGRSSKATDSSITSRTGHPIVMIDGVQHTILGVNGNPSLFDSQNVIRFPPSPDGTKTYNSLTGDVIQHNDTNTAFASETSTNKVITSRKDLVLLETWHEVLDGGYVFPLGNVQFGAPDYNGVTVFDYVNDYGQPQGYCAFGQWDTVTTGRCVPWDELNVAQKLAWVKDPDHNIYYDTEVNKFVQVKYRIRAVEGLGDNWGSVSPFLGGFLSYQTDFTKFGTVSQRGQLTDPTDLIDLDAGGRYGHFMAPNREDDPNSVKSTYPGAWKGSGLALNENPKAHNGLIFALPIMLVQRLNQGAYHPSYNPQGTTGVTGSTGNENRVDLPWFDSRTITITSKAQCFEIGNGSPKNISPNAGSVIGGVSQSGRRDLYKYHDAIYAGMVEDLRLPASKVNYSRVLTDNLRKAVNGKIRGKQKVPYTRVLDTTGTGNATPSTTQTYSIVGITDHTQSYFSIGDLVYTLNNDATSWQKCKILSLSVSSITLEGFDGQLITKHDSLQYSFVHASSIDVTAEYDTLPWVDILGSPERIYTTFPNGVIGQWIPNLPDGTNKQANRKINGVTAFEVFTMDNGSSWTSGNVSVNNSINTIGTLLNTNSVALFIYDTSSNFTAANFNTSLVSDISDTYVSNNSNVSNGNRINYSLINKVTTGVTYPYNEVVSLTSKGQMDSNILSGNVDSRPLHFNYRIQNSNNSPAVKSISALIVKNNLLYIQYNGRELNYDVNWGDDNSIPIVNHNTQTVDENGNSVRAFCHHSIYPVGIADYTETN